MAQINIVPIDALMEAANMSTRGTIELNENTYDFDPENPKDHWLFGAFLGFQKLKEQGFTPKSFATIGTGSGLDSIGAYEVFRPEKIFQTDIHQNVIEIAERNVLKHVGDTARVETFLGDLCNPLIERNITVDLLYANIPNIPSETPVWDGKLSASRFKTRDEECLGEFKQWLLELQYHFLRQAKKVLNPRGVLLIAIGDRVPQDILNNLFTETGYTSSELTNTYKIQTEPEEIITGYAEQEIKYGIQFDFYDHEQALPTWEQNCEGCEFSITEIKNMLQPFRLSAQEALKEFRKGKNIGHLYSIFKLTPLNEDTQV